MIYETEDIMKNVNPKEAVDLSTVMEEIKPKQYYIFKTGGPHFFARCKNKSVIRDIFLKNIWPFIYNTQAVKKFNKIITGTISKTKLNYPTAKLQHATKKMIRRNFRKITEIEERERPVEIELTMHRAVALAFIPNPTPDTHSVVDHLNGNRVDYRLENLRWTTLKGNSKGSGGEKSYPDVVYELISQQLWFNGKGSNTVKTAKDLHHDFIMDGGMSELQQKLKFEEDFENNLGKNETQ